MVGWGGKKKRTFLKLVVWEAQKNWPPGNRYKISKKKIPIYAIKA